MKIRALRVEINGELVAVAGAEKLCVLTGSVGFGPASSSDTNLGKVFFSVMGLEVGRPQPQQLTWGNNVQLNMGDKVTFQLVEVEHPSPPSKVLTSPSAEELAAAALQEKNAAKKRGHDA
jgi:hypothetical protein